MNIKLKDVSQLELQPETWYLVRVNSQCHPAEWAIGEMQHDGSLLHEESGTDLMEYAISFYLLPQYG